MDSHGYFRCSLSQLQESKLAEVCDRIILEVNPNIPFVGGDTAIHISQIDCLIEVDTPVPQTPRIEPNETEQTIGGYIAELIHDGDTIQLGIGGIPNAVGKALLSKHDLGVHTEMLTNSISDLVEANVVTGRKKNIHKGKIIATFALGDATLYKMMDHNPAVEILRAEYVNDPFVIKQNDNMVSINTCISIDLTGQVNSESIGAQQYSGTGGQSDTAYGAIHAKNGRSIIALTSTALDGKISSIVPVLAPGAVVSLQRNNVDLVVTEYGVARLRGRNISERVENLIAIAHPDFREELRVGARQYDLR
jgi:acyl-CoA hydrolase